MSASATPIPGDWPSHEAIGPLENITLQDAAGFDLPVLLVRGADSNILAPDAAERFAAALPKGTLVTVPKAGHNVHGQNTKGFITPPLTAFWRRFPQGRHQV